MNDINRRSVRVDLKDVYGDTIHDDVTLTFHNQRASSLGLKFRVSFEGAPAALFGVPAYPFSRAEVIIQPRVYRYKSILADIPAVGRQFDWGVQRTSKKRICGGLLPEDRLGDDVAACPGTVSGRPKTTCRSEYCGKSTSLPCPPSRTRTPTPAEA